jgi:hypothetical protein
MKARVTRAHNERSGSTPSRGRTRKVRSHELIVPTPVIVEAWRGGPRCARIAALLDACIERWLPQLASVAGEAVAAVEGATVVGAVVMA